MNTNLDSVKLNPINQDHQINITGTSNNSPSQSTQLNLPGRDLLDRREDFNEICVPLYNMLTTRRFEAAKAIIDKRNELVHFGITESCETPLHVAVFFRQSYTFVKYLMTLMTKEELELINQDGETSLCLAARAGNVEIAKVLVEKNKGLIDIFDSQGRIPLQVAVLCGKHDMVEYLYVKSQKTIRDFWTYQNRSCFLEKCVEADIFGVALQMVTDHQKLAVNGSLLRALARKRYAFRRIETPMIHTIINSLYAQWKLPAKFPDKDPDALKLLRIIMIEVMKLSKVEIDDIIRGPPDETKQDVKQTPFGEETQEALQQLTIVLENNEKMSAKTFSPLESPVDEKRTPLKGVEKKYSSRVPFLAAEMGNTAFLVEVFQHFPYLAREVNDDNHSVFHVAVSYRHEGIYKLLPEKDHIKDLIVSLEDKNGNNLLHLAGESANPNRLQKNTRIRIEPRLEIQLFKDVERILPSHLCEKKNKAGLTPYQLFIKNHEDVILQEATLMKETINQLMVVAALVATISFAALFTFPGGYDQDTGIPILLRKNLSKAFIVCDSLSFLFSTTSIVVDLSIIMPSHSTYDIMITRSDTIEASVLLVVYSIFTTIISFVISLFLLYQSHYHWIPILIGTFAPISYVLPMYLKHRKKLLASVGPRVGKVLETLL